MNVLCKRVHLLNRNPDNNQDPNLDHDLDNIAPCKCGIINCLSFQLEQKRRGGGFVCCDLPKVWTAFSQIVSKVEPCQQPDPEVMSLL